MNGDFKGDFTRDTFNKINHFSRVLMQQGRVGLDADWNEQMDILNYYLRTLTIDLVGSRVGRDTEKVKGFLIGRAPQPAKTTKGKGSTPPPDIVVGEGHYYVDGILCESDGSYIFTFSDDQRRNTPIYVVYLDVWERQVTYIENKSIREVALGLLGPDTATRAKVEWRVRATNSMPGLKSDGTPGTVQIPNPLSDSDPAKFIKDLDTNWVEQWVPTLQSPYRGLLKAKSGGASYQDTTPCIIGPEARFRGTENQLYRVEIHDSGAAGSATFKWSRENGSVVFPISNLAGKVVTLDTLGRDKRFGLKQDDWVEIVDDDYYSQDEPISLAQIESVDFGHMQVILKDAPTTSIGQNTDKHPFLRRWDQNGGELINGDNVTFSNGAIQIVESKDDTGWITLENNIQIQFRLTDPKANYRSGDYWLLPARTATGDIEWPRDENDPTLPATVGPHGVEHHYAPLALITFKNEKIADSEIRDLRRTLTQLWNAPTGLTV